MTVAARPPARRFPKAALTAIFALSVVAAGCTDKAYPPIPLAWDGVRLDQTSPANILTTLQMAYADRSIDMYRKLFADDFTFVFSPADTAGNDPTPARWGLADELRATSNMFRSEFVYRTELTSYVLGVPEPADSLIYGPKAWIVRVSRANLQVHARTEGGDTVTYVVDGATEVFYFREDPTRLIYGNPAWFIFRWEDQPLEPAKTESTSWGAIKARFM